MKKCPFCESDNVLWDPKEEYKSWHEEVLTGVYTCQDCKNKFSKKSVGSRNNNSSKILLKG